MTLLDPRWLWLLLAVGALAALYVLVQLRRKKYAMRFSNLALLASIAPRRPGWRRHIAFGLLVLALASFTVAMAKPSKQVKVPRNRATVMLVIDVSLSMQSNDVPPSRIQAAKKAAQEFTEMLPKTINIGLESFSGQVVVKAQPTTNKQAIETQIASLTTDQSTATGDAILSALEALKAFQAQFPGSSANVPQRIVMLSDGARTVGRPVSTAIAAAKQARVPVSTIAFGTGQGEIDLEGQQQPVPVDTDTMRAIAQGTGGSYHAAASVSELRSVYKNLGTEIGYVRQPRQITTWVVGIGLIFAFLGTGWALFWTNRVL